MKYAMVTAAAFAAASIQSSQALSNAKEEAANRKIMYAYARCVVHAYHNRASDMIVADEDNAAIKAHYSDLISEDCMARTGGNVAMSFGGDLYRYALADALVNADFALQGPLDFTDRLPLAHLVLPDQSALDKELATTKSKQKQEELKFGFNKRFADAWLSRYGECIVREDAVNSRLWVLTPANTPEETSRINMLRPAFSSCLTNVTLHFSSVVMRGIVAINYYRLAMATPSASLQKAH